MLWTYILLAISTSIDSTGIGITYGIRNITITKIAKLILFSISFLVASLAILIGGALSRYFPEIITKLIGSSILIFMGIAIILQIIKEKKPKKLERKLKNIVLKVHAKKYCKRIDRKGSKKSTKKVYQFFIKFLGVTIQIIREPECSDIDKSHKIDAKEASYLGIALSLDAFSVGIGTGMMGSSSLVFPILVSVFQIVFMLVGQKIGKGISHFSKIPTYFWNSIAAILLIGIGISRLFL